MSFGIEENVRFDGMNLGRTCGVQGGGIIERLVVGGEKVHEDRGRCRVGKMSKNLRLDYYV